jgi:alkylated DNA repair protein alkB family protein 1
VIGTRGGVDSIHLSFPHCFFGWTGACSHMPFSPSNYAFAPSSLRAGDTLGGHCDDVEADLAQPIVSVSLGCDAVFLMGSTTRDVPPTPVMLHSGDIVVLSGQARNCFHGRLAAWS